MNKDNLLNRVTDVLSESIGSFNTVGGPMHGDAGIDHPGASLHQPGQQNIYALNIYLAAMADRPYPDAETPIYHMRNKLNVAANFDFDSRALVSMIQSVPEGASDVITVPLTRFGGRVGILNNLDGAFEVGTDDGFDGQGMELRVVVTRGNRGYMLDPSISSTEIEVDETEPGIPEPPHEQAPMNESRDVMARWENPNSNNGPYWELQQDNTGIYWEYGNNNKRVRGGFFGKIGFDEAFDKITAMMNRDSQSRNMALVSESKEEPVEEVDDSFEAFFEAALKKFEISSVDDLRPDSKAEFYKYLEGYPVSGSFHRYMAGGKAPALQSDTTYSKAARDLAYELRKYHKPAMTVDNPTILKAAERAIKQSGFTVSDRGNKRASALKLLRAFLVKDGHLKEGYQTLPPIDRNRFTPIKGLEGPFRFRDGKILYYDPKEGLYYDRTTDMYMPKNYVPKN